MIREWLYIEPYKWDVQVFLDAKAKDAREILDALEDIGINAAQFMRAQRHLQKAVRNSGMTYSSGVNRESVVVIGQSSSKQEALNTFSHELRHLVDDIASANGIASSGEEVAYLTGNIALGLASCLFSVVCECPICSSHQ